MKPEVPPCCPFVVYPSIDAFYVPEIRYLTIDVRDSTFVVASCTAGAWARGRLWYVIE
jgi:hypothetical protein